MPVAATNRVGRSAPSAVSSLAVGGVGLTPDGLHHPVMQLGTTPAEARDLWAAVPPLGSTTALGSGRPGRQRPRRDQRRRRRTASARRRAALRLRPVDGVRRRGVVAVADAHAVVEPHLRDVLAAGRPLAGGVGARSRWRSTVPAVSLGEKAALSVDVRDAGFRPLPDATVRLRVTRGGATQELQATPDASRPGPLHRAGAGQSARPAARRRRGAARRRAGRRGARVDAGRRRRSRVGRSAPQRRRPRSAGARHRRPAGGRERDSAAAGAGGRRARRRRGGRAARGARALAFAVAAAGAAGGTWRRVDPAAPVGATIGACGPRSLSLAAFAVCAPPRPPPRRSATPSSSPARPAAPSTPPSTAPGATSWPRPCAASMKMPPEHIHLLGDVAAERKAQRTVGDDVDVSSRDQVRAAFARLAPVLEKDDLLLVVLDRPRHLRRRRRQVQPGRAGSRGRRLEGAGRAHPRQGRLRQHRGGERAVPVAPGGRAAHRHHCHRQRRAALRDGVPALLRAGVRRCRDRSRQGLAHLGVGGVRPRQPRRAPVTIARRGS